MESKRGRPVLVVLEALGEIDVDEPVRSLPPNAAKRVSTDIFDVELYN
jgi:hypothetical protein